MKKIEPRNFSFNNPFGACEKCTGIGYKQELDVDLMRKGAELLIGTHDFHNFVSGENESSVATIYSIDINKYHTMTAKRLISNRDICNISIIVGFCPQMYRNCNLPHSKRHQI